MSADPRKGVESRFLEFGGGACLEVMRRRDVTARFTADGRPPLEDPRRTGDGYYECVVRDPEGNRVEILAG